MIKFLAFTLLLTPIVLLPSNKSAFNLAEERKMNGAPCPPAQLVANSILPAATPVPLSVQMPQTMQANSSPVNMQKSNSEAEEESSEEIRQAISTDDDEKHGDTESAALYTSDEDAKILFELVKRLWGHLPVSCNEAVQERRLNRFFEAIDAHDLQTISALASKDIDLIFEYDQRPRYRFLVKTKAAQNLLNFYHNMLSVEAESVPNELWQRKRHVGDGLHLIPWRVDEDVLIDAKSLAISLTKDLPVPECSNIDLPNSVSLAEACKDERLCILRTLLEADDALSRASMGGCDGIVEALLNALAIRVNDLILHLAPLNPFQKPPADKTFNIFPKIVTALHTVLDCSIIAQASEHLQKDGKTIFQKLGLSATPQYEKYPAITRKLMQALIHAATSAEQYWIHQKRACETIREAGYWPSAHLAFIAAHRTSPLTDVLQAILCYAMKRGTPEMLQIIAEEMADIKRYAGWLHWDGRFTYNCKSILERSALETVNGEKLGILLSINSHPESMTYQLAMGMLSHVEKNPEMLARLKAYVRKCQMTSALLSQDLPPVLENLVAQYGSLCMPADTQDYILNLHQAAPKADENEKKD